MHDLIPLGPALLPGVLTVAEIDSAEAEKALATRPAYASDWKDFSIWCLARGARGVAAYLSGLADSGRKSSTIGRRAAAIGYHHKMAGHEPPTNQEAVKTVLRGIRRTIGSAKQGKAPATADLIGQMLALCPDTMIGKRDRALLCLGFAGAFRRSELCALQVADLTEVPDGLRILIRRSKGDQEGQGHVQRQSRWMGAYCLIQECSRAGRALPHQNAPGATSVCQSNNGFCPSRRRSARACGSYPR